MSDAPLLWAEIIPNWLAAGGTLAAVIVSVALA